jgi:protein-L-isoaspartate(D-aspartate) O-methyltransferase
MTTKEKRFPLSLASLADRRGGSVSKDPSANPQTAVRNAANYAPAKSKLLATSKLTSTSPALSNASYSAHATNSSKSYQEFASPTPRAEVMVSHKIRQAMVARVAQQGVQDKVVLAALDAIPRHLFIESGLSSQAYIDASLPIGHHQTISQPYIVARMSEIMRNGRNLNKILEIGTGCGYQAAVLSLLAKDVYSIERIKALHELAKDNLRPMRIPNIRLHYGDGMLGLPQVAPFDGIILAAAGLEVPQALLSQLSLGGRLIAPVGGRNQVLQLIERTAQNEWRSSTLESCHFVPLHQGVI